jgi:CRP/FNR family transcriptional regulator, dissimilatory nitrate respiration regulator
MIQIIDTSMSGVIEMLERLSAGAGGRRRLDAGEMLFATGDPVRSFFVIESGRLRLLRHTAHGTALVLHVAQAGEAFAEASLFSRTYHCDALAEISSTVIAYPKRALLGALREDPEAAITLVGHLAEQVQALRGRIELLNVKPARDRVLGYLHSRLAASATAVELDQTWKAIAGEIGLTHEAVYRALAELERDGLIQRDGNAVTLREP